MGAAAVQSDVSASVTGLRSHKGQVLACLTTNPQVFPNCDKDPSARKLTVPATGEVKLDFGPVPEGRYAISLVHDENGNGKLDTALMIPREGFGFSRDAPVRMGPPRFDKAAFDVGSENTRMAIKMRYLL
ncbi:DUF2141 domain-containing protein [Novosphingobium sp. ZW T3_23]|uniref:DUF2141 domain-containing protein n=1 Tax=Novosphingobium sp. ZW T3_23 TaxID=3378084 RepID=UPI003854AE74